MYPIYSIETVSGYYNFIQNLEFKLKAFKRLKQSKKVLKNKKDQKIFFNEKAFG
jgi:hypothetical protein